MTKMNEYLYKGETYFFIRGTVNKKDFSELVKGFEASGAETLNQYLNEQGVFHIVSPFKKGGVK